MTREDMKQSTWKTKGSIGNGTFCSVCDAHFDIFPNRYNFCPSCGTPMNEKALKILEERNKGADGNN